MFALEFSFFLLPVEILAVMSRSPYVFPSLLFSLQLVLFDEFFIFFISEISVRFFCVSFSLSSVLKFYLRPSRTFVVAA